MEKDYWTNFFGFELNRSLNGYANHDNIFDSLSSFNENIERIFLAINRVFEENENAEALSLLIELDNLENNVYSFKMNLKYKGLKILDCLSFKSNRAIFQYVLLSTYYNISKLYSELVNQVFNFKYKNHFIETSISEKLKKEDWFCQTIKVAISREKLSLNIDDVIEEYEQSDFDEQEVIKTEKILVKKVEILEECLND